MYGWIRSVVSIPRDNVWFFIAPVGLLFSYFQWLRTDWWRIPFHCIVRRDFDWEGKELFNKTFAVIKKLCDWYSRTWGMSKNWIGAFYWTCFTILRNLKEERWCELKGSQVVVIVCSMVFFEYLANHSWLCHYSRTTFIDLQNQIATLRNKLMLKLKYWTN